MLLGGLRRQHRFEDSLRDIPLQWAEFAPHINLPGRIGKHAFGVICGSSATGFEYMCAVQVEDFLLLPPGTGRMRIAPQTYAAFTHPGHVSEFRQSWDHIYKVWLPASGKKALQLPDFERYDEGHDPVSGRGGMEIWIPIEE
jgi:AraC family transcriptional regulator